MKLVLNNSDTIGIFTSLICSVHCFATPILFVAQSSFVSADIQPLWWESMNYLFIFLSFIAVYYSARNTSKNFMKLILWTCWLFFVIIILNEIIGITIRFNTISPNSQNKERMIYYTNVACRYIFLISSEFNPLVRLANIGIRAIGSTATNSKIVFSSS